MKDKDKFPNGVTSYLETHFEVSIFIGIELSKDTTEYSKITKVSENQGTGGIYELVEDLTDEFEKIHKDNDWSEDEYFETIEEFLHTKLS